MTKAIPATVVLLLSVAIAMVVLTRSYANQCIDYVASCQYTITYPDNTTSRTNCNNGGPSVNKLAGSTGSGTVVVGSAPCGTLNGAQCDVGIGASCSE
jgi:hypothetical protein